MPARLSRAAGLLARYRFQLWRYGDSIGLEGLLAAADVLDAPEYWGWAYGALKAWGGRPAPTFVEMDNTAPGHALCLCFERCGDDALIEAAVELAAFLCQRQSLEGVFVSWAQTPLRPPSSGERLTGPEAALLVDAGPGVFVDCAHFDPPFFAHLGHLTDAPALVQTAIDQMAGYVRLLQDGSGLFWHFYLERTGRPYGRAWGRGQGWALLGLLDLLEHVPAADKRRGELVSALVDLAEALRQLQRSDGGWYAVVDDPTSGDETSTAAFAAAGFARGVLNGLLDARFRPAAIRAWEYTLAHLDNRGVLQGISAAVWPCTNQSHYSHLSRRENVPWGQGPLLVAAKHIAVLSAQRQGADQ